MAKKISKPAAKAPQKSSNGAAKPTDSDHTLTAIFSYLSILVLIPLLAVKKRDEDIRFHLSQGLTLFIFELIVCVCLMILSSVPLLGWFFSAISTLVTILFLVVSIIAIVKALSGEKWKIPYLDFRFVNLK
jgi:uncharacterized membrane protein